MAFRRMGTHAMLDDMANPRWKQMLVAAFLLLPMPAWAWGPEGHEVVAHLAGMNLTPKARAGVTALLGGEAQAAMAIASNWADEIRDERPQTSSWHYVNLEIDGDLHYVAARDCAGDNCAVGQILRDEAILRSNAAPAVKAETLKFLIHFVGDIHQPLHAADNHDRGGNQVQISLRRGRNETLHHFWDDDVVAAQGRDPAAVARGIDSAYSPQQKAALMAAGSPVDWAERSAAIAKTLVYPQAAHGIDNRTLAEDTPIARERLARAGYALAGALNAIFR
jgi:hypothetical protein